MSDCRIVGLGVRNPTFPLRRFRKCRIVGLSDFGTQARRGCRGCRGGGGVEGVDGVEGVKGVEGVEGAESVRKCRGSGECGERE